MSEQTLFKVTVDNITIEVTAGTTILQAARQIGGAVAPPAMCYYSKLEGSGGKCRTCLVEVSKGSEKGEGGKEEEDGRGSVSGRAGWVGGRECVCGLARDPL